MSSTFNDFCCISFFLFSLWNINKFNFSTEVLFYVDELGKIIDNQKTIYFEREFLQISRMEFQACWYLSQILYILQNYGLIFLILLCTYVIGKKFYKITHLLFDHLSAMLRYCGRDLVSFTRVCLERDHFSESVGPSATNNVSWLKTTKLVKNQNTSIWGITIIFKLSLPLYKMMSLDLLLQKRYFHILNYFVNGLLYYFCFSHISHLGNSLFVLPLRCS